MNWYKTIKSNFEDDMDSYLEEDDIDSYADQAWDLASNSEINILTNKELARVKVDNGKLLGALWTSWDNDGEFSFDIIVDPSYRRMGFGSDLVDQAIEIFDWESNAFENPHYNIDAVNEDMVRILKNKGFIIKDKILGHILMAKPEQIYNPA